MNKLAKTPKGEGMLRRKLLAGASASSLALVLGISQAAAESEKPNLWIELGAQFEHRGGEDAPFVPMFTQTFIDQNMVSPLDVQHPPKYSFGGEGSLQYQPEGWDWKLSASILFGRSNGDHHRYQTKTLPPTPKYFPHQPITSDDLAHYKESHAVLDFQAGKDVGLGLFGHSGSSTLNFGVRIAQLSSKESLNAYACPTELISFPPPPAFPIHLEFGIYTVSSRADRNFRGIGPSIRWNGSTPVAGNKDDVELAIDWSLQGSALFGRQRANLHLMTVDNDHYFLPFHGLVNHPITFAVDAKRARSLVVPNLGGSLALSVKFPNAKISIGYRADEFFNAMDTGISTRKTSNVLFHGPFASVSFGFSPFGL